MWNYIHTDELYHWGIKGMKWGVRRFQNKDGSLTPAGRKRYSDDVVSAKNSVAEAKVARKAASKEYSKAFNKYNLISTKKNYQIMKDAETKSRDARLAYESTKRDYKTRKAEEDGLFDPNRSKSKHRQNLEEKYRKRGYDDKQAAMMANDRIRAEKIVATAAALTLTAATAYAANKYVKDRTDGILKAGTKLQRVSSDPNESLDRAFYGAYKKGDRTKYKGMYGKQIKMQGGDVHKMTLNVNEDVKIASRRKAEDAFMDLYKNDEEFRNAFKQSNNRFVVFGANERARKIHATAAGEMTDRQLRKAGYEAFNIGLVNHDKNGNIAAKKFYDKLKSQGYDAVIDINDKKYSGYKAKAPVIVFNKGNKISLADVKQMTDEQIMSNAKKAAAAIYGPEVIKTGAAYTGVLVGGTWGSNKILAIRERRFVEDYRKAHPETRLTDSQIIANRYK